MSSSEICETYSIIGIFAISLIVIISSKKHNRPYHDILVIGLLLRLILLIMDYWHILPVPHSGSDTEAFYRLASSNLLAENKIYLTNYSAFLTYLFEIIGPQRLFAQYLNVLTGIGTIIYSAKTLRELNVPKDVSRKALWFIALFPQLIIFSSILLRESFIIFFVSVSIYHLSKWGKTGIPWHYVFAIIFILFTVLLHSGMIGVLIGYLLLLTFYDQQTNTLNFSHKSIFISVLISILFIFIVIKSGLFLDYFGTIFDHNGNFQIQEEELLGKVSGEGTDAGSAYLQNIQMNNLSSILLFSPLKIFYFLFSPMPWDWRSLIDAFSFLLDSLLYLILIINIYRNKSKSVLFKANKFLVFVLLSFWFSVTIYSLGTIAAGTAIRHRANFIPLLIVLYCCSISKQSRTIAQNSNYYQP